MKFDRQSDPSPLPAEVAVARGQLLINRPVQILLLGGFGIAFFLLKANFVHTAALVAVTGFVAAWLWWSWFIPQWRAWAHGRGADPEEVQNLGVAANLVWPKGSFFERTEIRRNGR